MDTLIAALASAGTAPTLILASVLGTIVAVRAKERRDGAPGDDIGRALAELRASLKDLAETQTEMRVDLAGKLAAIVTRLDALERQRRD